ncbi:MAG TPA: DUF6378 domain-containing protein [Aquabacterium sp.]|nr:DUF6378 domain-containing protein [Aquabacterium sp.]
MSTTPSTAPALLDAALQTLAKRGTDYDQPHGERSMAHCVRIFNAITGQQMSERDGWLFMVALKLARSQKGAPKADTYLDGAAYFALFGECEIQSADLAELNQSLGLAP